MANIPDIPELRRLHAALFTPKNDAAQSEAEFQYRAAAVLCLPALLDRCEAAEARCAELEAALGIAHSALLEIDAIDHGNAAIGGFCASAITSIEHAALRGKEQQDGPEEV